MSVSQPEAPAGGTLLRLLQRLVAVQPGELRAVAWCWLYAFVLLAANYILTPIRDQMGVAGGVKNLPWLFVGTLAGTIILNVPFSWLVKKLPRSRFIPLTYRFFAAVLLLFAVALLIATRQQSVWVGRIFYIWVSVTNLFIISVFWQLNVDLFSPAQGKRLFGFIAAGATIGAMVGSAYVSSFAKTLSPTVLLVSAAVLLEVAVFCAGRLARLSPVLRRVATQRDAAGAEKPLGGGVFSGMYHAIRSPYLLGLCAFLLLYSVSSTFAYSQQATILSHTLVDRAAQTAFFANVNLGVNSLALVLQLFFTGRIVLTLGLALALAILPLLTMAGFAALAISPTLGVIAVFQVVRRGTEYAITRPAREVVYTVVSREDRYKTKGFIDTFVYRLGDQVGIWSATLFSEAGARLAPLVAIGLAALWLLSGIWLGRRQRVLEAQATAADR